MEILAGENIKVTVDGDKTIISALTINQTRLKNGPFIVSGNEVVIEAGERIKISTVHPDKLIISADINKEIVRIVDLETRIANLEKVISKLLRTKNDDQP